jgi:hypothetical protein
VADGFAISEIAKATSSAAGNRLVILGLACLLIAIVGVSLLAAMLACLLVFCATATTARFGWIFDTSSDLKLENTTYPILASSVA